MKCAIAGLLIALVGTTMARPADMTEEEYSKFQMTGDRIGKILKAYEPYKKFMPDYVNQALSGLTEEQKNEIAKMVNDFHAGKFPVPKDITSLISVMEKDYPSLAGIAKTLDEKYRAQLAQLGPKAQELFKKVEADGYAAANPDRIVWACNLFNNAPQVVQQAKALIDDADESAKLDAVFPQFREFLQSKEFEAYSVIVRELKPLDCAKDRNQIFNTIKLFDMHNVITTKD